MVCICLHLPICLKWASTSYCSWSRRVWGKHCEYVVDRSNRNDTYLYSLIAISSTSCLTNIFSHVRKLSSSISLIYDLNMFDMPLHGTTHRLHQLNKVFLRNKARIVFIYLLIYRMPQFTLRIVLHHKLHQYTNLDIQRKVTFFFPCKFASVHILLSNRYTLINVFFVAGSVEVRVVINFEWVYWLLMFCHTCEWSFRRFTYGNLVTTSPSSKW